MKWAGINPLQRKFLEEGRISPRAMRRSRKERRMLLGMEDDVADNGNVAGAVSRDHINKTGRQWPAVKKSNNNKGRSKLGAKENEQTYGDWYSGRSSRP